MVQWGIWGKAQYRIWNLHWIPKLKKKKSFKSDHKQGNCNFVVQRVIWGKVQYRIQGYRDRTSDRKLGFAWFWKGRCNYYLFGINQQLLCQNVIGYWFLSNKLQDLLAKSAPTNQQLEPMAALFKILRKSFNFLIFQKFPSAVHDNNNEDMF